MTLVRGRKRWEEVQARSQESIVLALLGEAQEERATRIFSEAETTHIANMKWANRSRRRLFWKENSAREETPILVRIQALCLQEVTQNHKKGSISPKTDDLRPHSSRVYRVREAFIQSSQRLNSRIWKVRDLCLEIDRFSRSGFSKTKVLKISWQIDSQAAILKSE